MPSSSSSSSRPTPQQATQQAQALRSAALSKGSSLTPQEAKAIQQKSTQPKVTENYRDYQSSKTTSTPNSSMRSTGGLPITGGKGAIPATVGGKTGLYDSATGSFISKEGTKSVAPSTVTPSKGFSGSIGSGKTAEVFQSKSSRDAQVSKQASLPSSVGLSDTSQQVPSSIAPSTMGKDGGFYQQGFISSFGQSAQILGSNIKYNVGAAFSDKPYRWDSIGNPFGYSGQYIGDTPDVSRGVKQGTILPGSQPYYTQLETRQMGFQVKSTADGTSFTIPGTSDLYTRTGEKYFQEAKTIGGGVALAGVSIVAPEALAVYGAKEIQQNVQQVFNPQLSSQERTVAGLRTIGGGLAFGGGVQSSFIKGEIAQVKASQEYITELNQKIPYTGKTSFKDGTRFDVYGKTIKTDAGLLSSEGQAQFKLTGPNTYSGSGSFDTTTKITGVWSGNVYAGSESSLFSIPSGKLYPQLGEVSPSIASPTFQYNFLKTQSVYRPSGLADIKISFNTKDISGITTAGRTTQQGQFLIGQSGQLGRVNINKGLTFVDNQLMESSRVSGLITKGGGSILKIEPLKTIDIQGGLGFTAGGTTQSVQQFGQLTQIGAFTPAVTPSVGSISSSISGLNIGVAGLSSIKTISSPISSTQRLLKISSQMGLDTGKTTKDITGLTNIGTNTGKLVGFQTIPMTSTTTTTANELTQGFIIPSGFSGGFAPSQGFAIGTIIPPLIGYPQLGGFANPNPRRRKRGSGEFNITPSFTGIITGVRLKDSLKVSKEFGVSPTQFRGLAPSTKKGKKKKPYFKLTSI
jgi:hypothetical protein